MLIMEQFGSRATIFLITKMAFGNIFSGSIRVKSVNHTSCREILPVLQWSFLD